MHTYQIDHSEVNYYGVKLKQDNFPRNFNIHPAAYSKGWEEIMYFCKLISMASCKNAVSLLSMHWRYCILALNHWYMMHVQSSQFPCCVQYPSTSFSTYHRHSLITKFMGPRWGPSWADRTQVGPMLAPMNCAIWVFSYHNWWCNNKSRFHYFYDQLHWYSSKYFD